MIFKNAKYLMILSRNLYSLPILSRRLRSPKRSRFCYLDRLFCDRRSHRDTVVRFLSRCPYFLATLFKIQGIDLTFKIRFWPRARSAKAVQEMGLLLLLLLLFNFCRRSLMLCQCYTSLQQKMEKLQKTFPDHVLHCALLLYARLSFLSTAR